MTKKIVVTGIGASTPLGGTAPESWAALLAGESGAHALTQEWVEELQLPVTFAAEAKVRPDEVLERQEIKRLDPTSQFALISAREAWADAGLADAGIAPERVGVEYSTGIGGLWTLIDAWDTLKEKGPRRVLPMTVPMLMPNAAAAAVSMALNARAFARTDVSACASSTEAIANAYDHLQLGYADVDHRRWSRVLHPRAAARRLRLDAGAVEAQRRPGHRIPPLRRRAVTASSWARARPRSSSRPRSTRSRAAPRSTPSSPAAARRATRTTSPLPTPRAGAPSRAVLAALEQAGATPDEVTHINAHATRLRSETSPSTTRCVAVFGDRAHEIPVSATKASTGHLLGGTGALEAIFTILAIHEQHGAADDQPRRSRTPRSRSTS